jgi:hypothetical protein
MAVAVAGVPSGTSFATTYAPARHGKKPSRKWRKAQITLTEKMMGTTNQKMPKQGKPAKSLREYGEAMMKVKQREMPKRNMRAKKNKG